MSVGFAGSGQDRYSSSVFPPWCFRGGECLLLAWGSGGHQNLGPGGQMWAVASIFSEPENRIVFPKKNCVKKFPLGRAGDSQAQKISQWGWGILPQSDQGAGWGLGQPGIVEVFPSNPMKSRIPVMPQTCHDLTGLGHLLCHPSPGGAGRVRVCSRKGQQRRAQNLPVLPSGHPRVCPEPPSSVPGPAAGATVTM